MSPESIQHIKGQIVVDGIEPYWWKPKPREAECYFGIHNSTGSWHLEHFSEPAPTGPEDTEAIARLLEQLWNQYKSDRDTYPGVRENPGVTEDEYIRLAAAYGVTLEP